MRYIAPSHMKSGELKLSLHCASHFFLKVRSSDNNTEHSALVSDLLLISPSLINNWEPAEILPS